MDRDKQIPLIDPDLTVEYRNQGAYHANYADHPSELKTTYRSAILVVIPLFMGYAALFSLQGRVRDRFNQQSSTMSKNEFKTVFQGAAACLYLGNFCLRLGHNIVFSWMNTRTRVYASQTAMLLSMAILCVFAFTTSVGTLSTKYLSVVFFAYFLGGISIGSFEANILNVLVPLGPSTKLWAISGMPVGIVSTTVGMFFFMQYNHDELGPVYLIVCGLLVMSMLVFAFVIPHPPETRKSLSIGQFIQDLREWRMWMPPIPFHIVAMFFNMFCVACAIPLALYLYAGAEVKEVHYKPFGYISRDYFMIIFNFCFSLADLVSRKVLYPGNMCRLPKLHPLFFLIFSGSGFALVMSRMPVLAPLGGFLIAWGNGSLYAQTSFHVDDVIDRKYNLTALSVWLFLGDLGSVIGTLIIKPLTS